MRDSLLLWTLVLLAPALARADEDEYVFDVGLGPRVQLLSEDRAVAKFNTKTIDWPSPYLGVRYGLTDFARYGAVELGLGAQYSAESDACYCDVEWEPGKMGDALANIESWNVGVADSARIGPRV